MPFMIRLLPNSAALDSDPPPSTLHTPLPTSLNTLCSLMPQSHLCGSSASISSCPAPTPAIPPPQANLHFSFHTQLIH